MQKLLLLQHLVIIEAHILREISPTIMEIDRNILELERFKKKLEKTNKMKHNE